MNQLNLLDTVAVSLKVIDLGVIGKREDLTPVVKTAVKMGYNEAKLPI
jgi:hypothetical protein